MKNAVIYARFSSHSQTEMSIEGQVAECRKYADEHGLVILQEYIDRAQSATTDKRPEFLRMIDDSEGGLFDTILVYQLDRFARNRNDSGYYKKILADNNVKVVSVKESIADDSSGVITEGLLEVIAEYYSRDLSDKIRRGVKQRAELCKYMGGVITFGYAVDNEGRFILDEVKAPVVREIYQRIADGEVGTSIMEDLNNRGIKTSREKEFSKNSLHNILRNERYKGVYIHGDVRIEGGMPRIVSDELFEEVQELIRTPKMPHRPAIEDYILTGKLYCGHCKSPMIGTSGTSKTGATFRYYKCSDAPKKCHKKNVRKDYLEPLIFNSILQLITDDVILKVVEAVKELNEHDQESSELIRLRTAIKKTEEGIERLLDQIEEGSAPVRAMERAKKREEELALLERQFAIEKAKQLYIDPENVRRFLKGMRQGEYDDIDYQKMLIRIFVDRIYLYDDHFRILLNYRGKRGRTSEKEAQTIERYFDNQGSNMAHAAPPYRRQDG